MVGGSEFGGKSGGIGETYVVVFVWDEVAVREEVEVVHNGSVSLSFERACSVVNVTADVSLCCIFEY